MDDTVRTGLNRVRLPISPSTHIINKYYTDFLNKSQEKNKIDVNELRSDRRQALVSMSNKVYIFSRTWQSSRILSFDWL